MRLLSRRETMASGVEEFQFALSTCPEHSNHEIFVYCNTCEKKICELCVKGNHKDHDWTSISNYVRKLRREGKKMSQQIHNEILPLLRAAEGKVRRDTNRKEILRTQQNFKEAIDTYAQSLLSVVDAEADDDRDLEMKIDEFVKLANFFEDHIESAHDNVVLDMGEEYDNKIKEYRQSIKQPPASKCFERGVIVEETMKDMFGRMVLGKSDTQSMEKQVLANLIRSVEFGTKAIIGLWPISERRAWIHPFESSKNILLFNETGKSIVDRDFGRNYNDFILEGESHIYTSVEEEAVFKYTKETSFKIYDTTPYFSSGICQSQNGGILVCLIEGDRSEITLKTKGEVHHIDITGDIIEKYAINKDSGSGLFKWPNKVAQNMNLDVCVLDFISIKENDRLVVVSVDSKLRFTYSGQPSMKQRFAGGNVICDSAGKIFLTDYLNCAIHILSADGAFLQYLLKSEDDLYRPCSLSLKGDTLWIGCTNGVIRIYKIK